MELAKLDAEIEIKMNKLRELLEDEKFIGELCSAALWNSVQANNELQEIRREPRRVLNEVPTRRRGIGIKRMGELNLKPFLAACQRKYGANDRACELVSVWQEQVKNPSWHPFKIVEVDGIAKAVVDDDDGELAGLREEYGDDVCNAVKVAVAEINEYNPSGGVVVAELWNFSEGRKATVNEALKEVCRQLSNPWKRCRNMAAPPQNEGTRSH